MEQKDLKIGLALGLGLVIIVVLVLATDPRLSPRARMLHLQDSAAQDTTAGSPNHSAQTQSTQQRITLSQPSLMDLPERDSPPGDGEQSDFNRSEFSKGIPKSEESDAANTEESQSVSDEEPTEPRDISPFIQGEKIKTQRFHIVRKDQTLSAISRIYYGSSNQWQKIVNANRDIIKDANKIQPGTKLIIPD